MSEKESILIVDDDEGTCRSLTLIFGKNNYNIDTANTGQEALEKAHSTFYNIILMDIRLPDMEGIELLSALKEINSDSDVLIITAYASLETAKRAVNEGASGYITKPINMNEVLTTVKKTLEKQRSFVDRIHQYKLSQKTMAELKIKADSLEYRSHFADVIIRVSSNLIATCFEQNLPDGLIIEALKEIGEYLDIDCSYIFLVSQNEKIFKKNYEWAKEGTVHQKSISEEISLESFPWLSSLLIRLQHTYISKLEDMPAKADVDKQFFKSANVKSFIIIPMANNNTLIGFWGIYTLTRERVWTEDEIALLRVTGDIFTSVISHIVKRKIRIAIAEEKTLLRNGISTAITNAGMEMIGESTDSNGLITLTKQYQPDVIVMSYNLPGLKRQELITYLKEIAPEASILIICRDQDMHNCFLSSIKDGAVGSLPTSSSSEQLTCAIRSIYHGQAVTTRTGLHQLAQEITYSEQQSITTDVLNVGELEILKLASRGMSNKAIGKQLSVSERTVDSRFRSIFSKTGTGSRTEAIYKALKNGWIILA